VLHSNGNYNDIAVVKKYPFTNYRRGDKIEIDNDITCYHYNNGFVYLDEIEANNAVRKFGSSSEVIRGQSIADRLISRVESQPPGKFEYEHVIEHRDRSPERHIYRRKY